jgi:hypothetical protein
MFCSGESAGKYSSASCDAAPAKSVYGLGPQQGPPITHDPSSYCDSFSSSIGHAPAYSTMYYSSYTPCSGLSSHITSPCSQYSAQSSCGGSQSSETGYHTMQGAYGGGGNMGPGDTYQLNQNYSATGGSGCGCGQ